MSHRTYDTDTEDQIIRQYTDGVPPRILVERFGGSENAIAKMRKRRGVEGKAVGRRPWRKFTDEEVVEMADMWHAGSSQTAIAKRFDTAQVVVSRVLRANGIQPTTGRYMLRPGFKSPSWKGGRIAATAGYIAVWVDPADPLAVMRTRMGYVLEHRLIMARSLGRPLDSKETVHHIDGNRQHNVLSNLQLRNGRHGKGAAYRCRDCGSYNVEAGPLNSAVLT